MNVPKLRFKEFTGEWEEKTLGEVTKVISLKNKEEAQLPIYSINNKIGFVPQGEQFENIDGISRGYDTSLYKVVIPNMFAYNPARINVGSIGYSANLSNVMISSLYVCFVLIADNDDKFYWQWFKSAKFNTLVHRFTEGGVRQYLFYENLARIKILVPSCSEQEKIALFLDTVDLKIENQKAIVESLEKQKKALMKKIFSQELRFKDDDGKEFPKWEEKKLGEVGCFTKGGNLSKADLSDYGTECILYGELYTRYSEIANNILSKTSVDKNTLYMSKYNDVLLPSSGETPEDISTATCLLKNGVALGGDLIVYRSDELDGRFNSYLLNHKCKMDIARIAQGKSVVHISSNALKKIIVPVPCLEEQKKIVGFLFAINEKIENAKKSLEHWQQIKKGLLQQMFV